MNVNKFFLSVSVIGAALLAGCGTHHSGNGQLTDKAYVPGSPEPASKPGKYGGTFVYGSIGEPKTFNVWVAGETASLDILGPLYDSLIDRNAYTEKFESRLADLPVISPDGLTYTFKIKPEARWSDGMPITAQDVIFTLDVLFNPQTQTIAREGMLVDVTHPDGTTTREPFKYRAIDSKTVQFVLPQPYAPAEEIFAGITVAPKHKLEKIYDSGGFNSAYNVDTPPSELVASGPWIMSEYVPGQRVLYKRNPYFWKKSDTKQQLPYFDSYVYEIVPNLTTTTLRFKSGDTSSLAINPPDYSDIKRGEANGNYSVWSTGPGWGFEYLCFNQNPHANIDPDLVKIFQDLRFRQAVSYAIDRTRMVNSLFDGLAVPNYGPLTPANTEFYDPNLPKTEFDLQKAQTLLSSMGLTQKNSDGLLLHNGKTIRFTIITNAENALRVSECAMITNELRKLGIDASFSGINFSKLISMVDAPPYPWEACLLGFTGGVDPYDGSNIWRSTGPSHQWHPNEKTPATPWEASVDKLWSQAAHEMDPVKRKALYFKWQDIIATQLPFIFTIVPERHIAIRNNIGNAKPCSLDSSGGLWNLEEEYDTNASRLTP